MRMFSHGILAVVAVVIAVPAGVFAIGSFTGDHSIKYDNDGTWLCWTPQSRLFQDCAFLAPLVPASYLRMEGEGERSSGITWTADYPIQLCPGQDGQIVVSGRLHPTIEIRCGYEGNSRPSTPR